MSDDINFSNKKRVVGRPIMIKSPTRPKTYCFFDSDINKMLNNGWAPKEVFRLGILAKENNPAMIDRIRELEERNKMLSDKLQKAFKRLNDLEGEVKI
jgi:hypothetical protein